MFFNNSRQRLVNSLEKQLQKLQTPLDYFSGREKAPPSLPTNLLLFHRGNEEELRDGETVGFHHHRYLLLFARSGTGTVLINEQQIEITPGSVFLISPYELHFYRDIEQEKISWLFVTFDYEMNTSQDTLQGRSWIANEAIEELVSQLLHQWTAREKGLVHTLSLILLKLEHLPQNSRHQKSKQTLKSSFLQVNQALGKNPQHPWTIDEIAHETGHSSRHLCRLFRQETNLSLGDYMRRYRVTRAAQLLQSSSIRIGEIASLCGFTNPYSFCRTFKKEMAMSPSEYRRNF